MVDYNLLSVKNWGITSVLEEMLVILKVGMFVSKLTANANFET